MNTDLLVVDEERAMPELLRRAQAGDEDAHRRLVLYVYKRYVGRVKQFYSKDPALDWEDLQATFFEGLMRFDPKRLDGRGSDFYHLAQRGFWYVGSKVKVLRRELNNRALRSEYTAAVTGTDLFDVEDRTEADFCELVHDQVGAEQVARIVAHTSVSSRSRELLGIILNGEAGDPQEIGFNQRLAKVLDRSPQRASQLMAGLRRDLRRAVED